ncbi:hypothetical protein [Pseudomonas sp. 2FE]|uniref:hypothetical protein n=1 Tax=Pseudomonas sp. 2FE TaxID=2502190 RepID=UPI0010F83C51|nr:hypothetical protein [Pseudomonas sp. 2FE]
MSTLPPFLALTEVKKNNMLSAQVACFLVKKGGQRAPISPGWKIREPRGPDDRNGKKLYQRDPVF